MGILTDETLFGGILDNLDVIHIVDVSDTTDDAGGSSFKLNLETLGNFFQGPILWTAGTGSNSLIQVGSGGASNGIQGISASNAAKNNSNYGAILGGYNHEITGGSDIGGIFCGHSNLISDGGDDTVILGGYLNTGSSASASVILGGHNNMLSGNNSVMLGGSNMVGNLDNMVFVPDITITNLLSNTNLTTNASGMLTGTPSDERLKTNIFGLTNALDKITNLRGVSFEWNKESNMGTGETKFGFIAQEVQEVIPRIVGPMVKDSDILTLDYKELVPFLVEAIKEQQIQINNLKNLII